MKLYGLLLIHLCAIVTFAQSQEPISERSCTTLDFSEILILVTAWERVGKAQSREILVFGETGAIRLSIYMDTFDIDFIA